MKNVTGFRERFNRWKNGEKVYEAGLPVDTQAEQEDPSLRAALEYALSLKLDEYNSGKDNIAGGYSFNAIKQVSPDAPLSYGSYYDLTGDYIMDNKLPKYAGGKNVYNSVDDIITKYEGFVDTVYQNKGDVPTVGYGTTAKKWIDLAKKQGRITEKQGRQALREHLDTVVVPTLQKKMPGYSKMPRTAQWVLQDILYNVGEGNLFDKSPKFMAAAKRGDWQEMSRQMDWDNNKAGYSNGAKKRNAERQRLWNDAWNGFDTTEKTTIPEIPTPVEPVYNKENVREATYIPRPKLDYEVQAEYTPYIGRYYQNKNRRITLPPVLPSIIDTYNQMWGDGSNPLQKPW